MNQLEISFGTPLRILVAKEEGPSIVGCFTVWYDGFKITSKGDIMYTLQVDHYVNVQVAYQDAAGNPASIDGNVLWSSSNESIVTVTPDSGDSTQCKIQPVSGLGQAQVRAQADADLGSGVKGILTVMDVEIVAGEAVVGTISPVGEAQPIGPVPVPNA